MSIVITALCIETATARQFRPCRAAFIYSCFVSPLRCRVAVDAVDHAFDALPQGQVGEHLHNAATVSKGWFLQNGQVFHHTVVDDVLHDLVDKVDLPGVQAGIVEISGKGLLGGVHVQADDLPHELAQRFGAHRGLVVLAAAHLAPQDVFQFLHISCAVSGMLERNLAMAGLS